MVLTSELRRTIFNGFAERGLPGNLGLALARQESNFKTTAVATHPADIARGGAYGLLQMTYKTAVGLGYEGPPEGLLNTATNIFWASKLCAQNAKRTKAVVGSREWVYDVAAMYNSGRLYAAAPDVTRNEYAPRVWGFFCAYSEIKPTSIA